jgi:hypothetical protein
MSSFNELSLLKKMAFLPNVKELYIRQASVPGLVPTNIMDKVMSNSWDEKLLEIANAGSDSEEKMKMFLNIKTSNRILTSPITVSILSEIEYSKIAI